MNPIDDAILEGLLENRIYAIESNRILLETLGPGICWSNLEFREKWSAIQFCRRRFGLYAIRHVRSGWAVVTDPHRELDRFAVSSYCEQYLQYELQKNMTE